MVPLKIALGFQSFARTTFTTSLLDPGDSVVRGGKRHEGHRSEGLRKFMLRADSSFLKYRNNPFFKPGILAAHDCLR